MYHLFIVFNIYLSNKIKRNFLSQDHIFKQTMKLLYLKMSAYSMKDPIQVEKNKDKRFTVNIRIIRRG